MRRTTYQVMVNGHQVTIEAHTPGAAVRLAVKKLIADGILKRQPRTTRDGDFDGVSVKPIKEPS